MSVGLRSEFFASTAALLERELPDTVSCLVLDVRLPGVSGLDFQKQLSQADIRLPIIFMTSHGDIPMTVGASKGGAVDFLAKPFRDQNLLDAVASAPARDKGRRERDDALSDLPNGSRCIPRKSGKSWNSSRLDSGTSRSPIKWA
jgi:FixJ family two-component response regulator